MTAMELRTLENRVLIEPLWNWNVWEGRGWEARGGLNRTFMELKYVSVTLCVFGFLS